MLFVLDIPAMVEDTQIAPLKAETEVALITGETEFQIQKDFYARLSFQELEEGVEQYRLEQEELARLQKEKEEAESRERERIRAEQERLRKEEERRLQALLKPTFDPYNITKPSNLNSEQFYQLLGNTGLSDVAWVFPYAEEQYGINGLFLAGITALESGWGDSQRARNHYNLTGYGINTDAHVVKFERRSDSVLATAKLLAKHYVPSDGMYHQGLSVWNINQSYCAQSDWSEKVIAIATKLLNSL